jgi:peptide/nickel transport system permease protein
MATFVVRRLLQMVPLLLGITVISFLVIEMAPGDYFTQLRMNPQLSPEAVAKMEREFGYGAPLPVRYARWLWRALHFDFGLSLAYRVEVTALIGARAFNTVVLALSSIVVTWALAIPIGVLIALYPRSLVDRVLSFLAFFGMCVPSFFLAFLMMYVALRTGWFPVGGSTSIAYDSLPVWGRVWDRVYHLILPVVVLGIGGMASLTRLMRANVLEIKQSDYVRTARAKGLSEWTVITRHILRNALNPFVTLAGYELGNLLGGAALVEAVMNLQGLGTLMLEAVRALDLYLVMGSVVMGSLLLLAGNLLADVVLTLVDPRIDFRRLEATR